MAGTLANMIPAPENPRASMNVELLETIFDHVAGIAFFIKDGEGRYRTVNRSLVERHGLSAKEDIIGKRPCDVCPGDLGGIPTEQDRSVLKTGQPIVDHLELHWYLPNRPCWCLTTKLPLRDAGGRVTGLIGISQDVRVPVGVDEIPCGLAHALGVLETDCSARHSASSLAKASGLSPARFALLVRRIFGLTPTQLITKTRVDAAMRLLRETDRNMADIAAECGFYDHSAFTRAFRSAMGITPSKYRGALRI